MDVERLPIDQYVCDGCNTAITDTDFVCQQIGYLYDHGLYCAYCRARYYSNEKPLRIYLKGHTITDLPREMCISSFETFDPEKFR